MTHFIIGTAGHIDHGKTSLVKALTGTDTDSLKEEKERNITIDIGFAFMGENVTIIDVPGHEKFIKNMVAGVSTIDFVLFVIAADDGIMPQTKEHLDILKLLQIKDGMIVLTKADMVEEDWIELVSEDIQEYVKGSFLENKPLVVVDSLSGRGIEEVKNIIYQKRDEKEDSKSEGIFKLPIDRVFSVKGYGTVITGTILSGKVNEGDKLSLQPSNKEVRVKAIQSHGVEKKSLVVGNRAAINLHGVSKEDIHRGDILVTSGYLSPSFMFDSKLYLLKNATKIKNRTRVRIHAGTKEVFGRITLLDKEELNPGEEGFIQIRLEEEMNLSYQERYVIRTYSPQFTIGGGSVIRITKKKSKRFDMENIAQIKEFEKANPEKVVENILLQSQNEPLSITNIATKISKSEVEIELQIKSLLNKEKIITFGKGSTNLFYHNLNIEEIGNTIFEIIKTFHETNPYRSGISKADLKTKIKHNFNAILFDLIIAEWEKRDLLKENNNLISEKYFQIVFSKDIEDKVNLLSQKFKEMRFKPDQISDIASEINLDEKLVKEMIGIMISQKKIVKITETIYFDYDVFEEGKNAIKDYIIENDEIKLGDVTKLLDSSRKYALPLMEYLDKIKFTLRQDMVRVLY